MVLILQGERLIFVKGKSRYDVFGDDVYKDSERSNTIGKKELVEVVGLMLLKDRLGKGKEMDRVILFINHLSNHLGVKLRKRWKI